MRFKVSKNSPFKKVAVRYTWTGDNLYVVVFYTSSGRWGVNVHVGQSSDSNDLKLYLVQDGKNRNNSAVVTLIPSSPRMAKLFKNCFVHKQASDYCDTQIMLMPSVTNGQWIRSKDAKRV